MSIETTLEQGNIKYGLRKVWGDRFMDKYISWCFDFSCEESKFIQLKESCVNDLEYKVAFSKLCRFREEMNVKNLFVLTKGIKNYLKVDYTELKGNINLIFNNNFEQQIKEIYYPSDTNKPKLLIK